MNRIQRRNGSKSGLFLMELIIAILFFSFASAICIQVFAKAHITSTQSRDLTAAITQAQSAAEAFKSCDGSPSELANLLDAQQDDDGLTVSYDKQWNRVPSGQDAFRMTIQIIQEDALYRSQIQILDNSEPQPIYEITVKKYIPA